MRLSTPPVSAKSFLPCGNHIRHLCLMASDRQSELVGRFIAARAFADRRRYLLFLRASYRIATDQSALYSHPLADALLPEPAAACPLRRVERDLGDLREPLSFLDAVVQSETVPASPAELYGRLFVAEGMRLMLPWLRKQAERLGFDDCCGARHLARDPADIRARWSSFVAHVNGMAFSVRDLSAMAETSQRAMDRIHTAIDEEMGAEVAQRCERRFLHG